MDPIKILSGIDLLIAAIIMYFHAGPVSIRIAILVMLYLFSKALIFRDSIASLIDGVIGIYVFIMLLGVKISLFTIVFVGYLLQKVFFGLI